MRSCAASRKVFLIRTGILTGAESGSIKKPSFTFCHESWGSLIDRPSFMAWFEQLTNYHGLAVHAVRGGGRIFSLSGTSLIRHSAVNNKPAMRQDTPSRTMATM